MLNKNTSPTKDVTDQPPKLAPPGAGVPFPQLMMMRFFVGPFVAGKATWSESEKSFHIINGKILKEIEGLTETQLSTKVLVPPQIGLEDSSRYWSIAMALEHLVIVGTAITSGIAMLSEGKVPTTKADTAKVKPIGEMPVAEAVTKFKKFTGDDFNNFLKDVKDKDSKLTYSHPWFGKFRANQWFWLLGRHSSIHLKQIREIKKGVTDPAF